MSAVEGGRAPFALTSRLRAPGAARTSATAQEASRPPADYLSLADRDLLALVGARDARAFEILYDRHARACYSLALRIVGDGPVAEDVTQEAFVNVWRSADTPLAGRGSVRAGLLAAVRNRALDHLRSRAGGDRSRAAAALQVRRHPTSEGSDRTPRDVRWDAVRRAMESLPREQVQALELAYFAGLSQGEISNTLGLPLETVKTRTRLGLKGLRAYLEALDAAL